MISTIIIIFLSLMMLGMNLAKHGENKCDEKYNFWYSLIGAAIAYLLYYHAGLFDKFF